MLIKAIKIACIYLPSFIKSRINNIKTKQKLNAHTERKHRYIVTLEEIETILNQFDFSNDIILHSSTSNIGKIEGGVVKLTDLLLSKIDLTSYTLLAPALPFLGSMKEYLDGLDAFDLNSAKNAMGYISNQIMKKEGCLRSMHPTHSVIAIGKDAGFYTEGHEHCKTPFCVNSPYHKITAKNGKILMFGVDLNSVTNFHVYEDIIKEYLPFEVYTKDTYRINCMSSDKEFIVETKAHNKFLSAKRDCELARKYLIKNNYIQTYQIGDSKISLLDSKGLTITLMEMLLMGESIYGKIKLTKKQIEIVKEKLKNIYEHIYYT
jgi:aminoglycoside 3-N-acetyltransferase